MEATTTHTVSGSVIQKKKMNKEVRYIKYDAFNSS